MALALRAVVLAGASLAACRFDPSGLAGGGRDAAGAGIDAAHASDARTVDAALSVDGALTVDASTVHVACPTDAALVACFPFDGDADDHSSVGSATTTAQLAFATGQFGQALDDSDGVTITLADRPELDPIAAVTLDAWVFVDTYPATGTRGGLFDNEGQWGFFLESGGRLSCSANTLGAVTVDAALPLGGWHHLACRYDGAELAIFRDGVRLGGLATTGDLTTSNTTGTAIGHNSPSGENLVGRIDEARIWAAARDPAALCGTPCNASL